MSEDNTHTPVIFLAFANPPAGAEDHLRHLGVEAHRLQKTLEEAEKNGLCQLVIKPYAQPGEILEVFREHRNRIAIFHYAGHAKNYELLLEDAAKGTVAVDGRGLAAFLGQQTGMRLVFLNGCSTDPQVKELLAANVPAVIATSQAIKDDVATYFAGEFYASLAKGATIQCAFRESEGAARYKFGSGNMRNLYRIKMEVVADRWPWRLETRPGAEQVTQWNLPDAADLPLFGLPSVPKRDLPESPYRHLNWFTQEHSEVFFGRGYQIRGLYQFVIDPESAPIILLYGQSGVGKSSLLAAGLIPRLEQTCEVEYLRRERKEGLLGMLQEVLQGSTDSELAHAWRAREAQANKPLVIILDQVEEVYTRPNIENPSELREFLVTIQAIFADHTARPTGKLVLCFRKEWLAEIKQKILNHKLSHDEVFLGPLDRRGIIRAIIGPTDVNRLQRRYKLKIEKELPGIIADDLLESRGSPLAPTLQILLTKLWDEAKAKNYANPVFDKMLYQDLKKQGLLLANFVDQQIRSLQEQLPESAHSGLALDVLAFHTTPLGSAEQRGEEELNSTYSHQQDELKNLNPALNDLYLLTEVSGIGFNEEKVTRLAHDTLAPLIRARFDVSDCPGQRARRILENRAVEWQEDQKGNVLDEPDLAVVEEGRPGMRQLNDTEERLVEASLATRRTKTQRRWAAWAAGLLLIISLMTVIGLNLYQNDKAIKVSTQLAVQTDLFERSDFAGILRKVEEILPYDSWRASEIMSNLYFPEEFKGFAWRYFYRFANRMKQTLTDHHGPVLTVAFSHKGQILASGGADGRIILRHTDTGKTLNTITAHKGWISAIAFSPDGKLLASFGSDEVLHVWSIETGKSVFTNKAGDSELRSIAFSPYDNELLVAYSDGKILGWSEGIAIPSSIIAEYPNDVGVNALAISKVGALLAAAGDDGMIRIWTADTGWRSPLMRYSSKPITKPMYAMSFSPDGKMLASGGADNVVTLWNVRTGERIASHSRYPDTGPVRSLAFLADGEILASASDDGGINLFEIATEKWLARLTGHKLRVWSVDVSPDGKSLASGSDDGTVRLWNIEPELDSVTVLRSHGAPILSLAFSSDGQYFGASDANGFIRLWDVASGQLHRTFRATASRVYSVTFSSDGKTIAWGGEDSTITTANIDTGEMADPLYGGKGWVHGIAYSSDGKLAAATQGDPTGGVQLWSGSELTSFDSEVGTRTVTFSSDGNMLAAGFDDGSIRIWIPVEGQPIRVGGALIGSSQKRVNAVAFSPDGTALAAARQDHTIGLYQIDESNGTAKIIRSIGGHSEDVTSVAFSPDGKTLASGSSDNSVRLWDPRSGDERLVLYGLNDSVRAIAFSPDSKTLAAAGEKGSIYLWHAPAMPRSSKEHVDPNDWDLPVEVNLSETIAADEPMIKVPGGCFEMGGEGLNEDIHEICVNSFTIGQHPVTVGEYRAFAHKNIPAGLDAEDLKDLGTSQCTVWHGNGWKENAWRSWLDPGFNQKDDHPVVCVNLEGINEYLAFLNSDPETMRPYRLPTEAEWEYAARGHSKARFWWGEDIGSNRANCRGCGSSWDNRGTAPVGSFEPNAFGLYDVLGNVLEWTCSAYGRFDNVRERVCATGDVTQRVLRGGSWYLTEEHLRTASRHGRSSPAQRTNTVGFRLVQDL